MEGSLCISLFPNEIQHAIFSSIPYFLRVTVCKSVCRLWYSFATEEIAANKIQKESIAWAFSNLVDLAVWGDPYFFEEDPQIYKSVKLVDWAIQMGYVPSTLNYNTILSRVNFKGHESIVSLEDQKFAKEILNLFLGVKTVRLGKGPYSIYPDVYSYLRQFDIELNTHTVLDAMQDGFPFHLEYLRKEGYKFTDHITKKIANRFVEMVSTNKIKPEMIQCLIEIGYFILPEECIKAMVRLCIGKGYDFAGTQHFLTDDPVARQIIFYVVEMRKTYPSKIPGMKWKRKEKVLCMKV